MKDIFYILLILFLSCKSQNKEFDNLGDKLISDENFVNRIEKTCSKETNPGCQLSKIEFNYKLKFEKDSIIYNEGLRIEISKIAKKVYKNAPENVSFILNTFKKDVLIDSLTIYEHLYFENVVYEKKYYLNKELELWILDFFIDDEGVFIKKWNKFKINKSSGKIELLKELIKDKYPSSSIVSDIKTVDSFIQEYDLMKFNNRKDFDFNDDKILDKILVFDYDDNFDCAKNKVGVRPILILKGNSNKEYELVKYSTETLTSYCSSGNAESNLDIYFKDNIFHFSSTYLNQNSEIYTREYFFKKDLDLDKIIFSKVIIGNDSKAEKIITPKDFSEKLTLLNFVFDETL